MAEEPVQRSDERVHRFIAALKQLEESGDTDGIAQLFTEDATVGNIVSPSVFQGPEGARRFWRAHRSSFARMESTFRNIISADDRAALEWVIEGTAPDGGPARQEGVSIMEWRGDRIGRFYAYFDSRQLGRQVHAASSSEQTAPGELTNKPE